MDIIEEEEEKKEKEEEEEEEIIEAEAAGGINATLLGLTIELSQIETMVLKTRDFFYRSQEECKRCTPDKSCSYHKNFAADINGVIIELGGDAKKGIELLLNEYFDWCKNQLVNETQAVPRKNMNEEETE
jgi:hypothetical protein